MSCSALLISNVILYDAVFMVSTPLKTSRLPLREAGVCDATNPSYTWFRPHRDPTATQPLLTTISQIQAEITSTSVYLSGLCD